MDNLLVVALLVASCIVINPFISASEKAPVTEQVAADQDGSDDQESDSDDEDEEEDEDQDSSN